MLIKIDADMKLYRNYWNIAQQADKMNGIEIK